jgi:GT2 family glycosyltransferase
VDVTPARPVLAVVPAFLREDADLELLLRCLVSLRASAPAASPMVVDDGSPRRDLVEQLQLVCGELGANLFVKPENTGFAAAANVGLQRALVTGADAVLVNADVELVQPGWLEAMLARTDTQGRPAAIVGARLLRPDGTIEHAGWFFSALTREWWHRFDHAPGDLPEALVPCCCPVGAALVLIRHDTLATVGPFDAEFRLGYEDVDLALRTFSAGLECVYEPAAVAIHAGAAFRGRATKRSQAWAAASEARLAAKWRGVELSPFVPEAL